MLRLISISFSIIIFSQSLNIIDISKVDKLIEHITFHSNTYGDSFFVFLSKHYGELKQEHSKKHQEEQSTHERLPFNHQSQTYSPSVFVLITVDIQLPKMEPTTGSSSNFHYQEFFSSFRKLKIFQPPKFA